MVSVLHPIRLSVGRIHASPAPEFPTPPHATPFPKIPPCTAHAVPDLEIPLPIAHASSHLNIPSPTPCTFFDPAHLWLTPPSFYLGFDFNETPLVMHTHIDHVPSHSESMSFMPTPGLHIDPMTTGLTHFVSYTILPCSCRIFSCWESSKIAKCACREWAGSWVTFTPTRST